MSKVQWCSGKKLLMLPGGYVSVWFSWRRWPWSWYLKNWVGIHLAEKIEKDFTAIQIILWNTNVIMTFFCSKDSSESTLFKDKNPQILRTNYFESFIIMCLSLWSFSSVLEGNVNAQKRLFMILLNFHVNIWHITDPT